MVELKAFPLPVGNTCSECGRAILQAYATSMDEALAGGGLCGECAERAASVEAEVVEIAESLASWSINDEIDATRQARKLADEHGIDLRDVAADLPDGQRVGKGDVQTYLDGLSLDDLLE